MGLRENLQESGSKGLFSPQNSGFPGRHSLKTDSEKKETILFLVRIEESPCSFDGHHLYYVQLFRV